LIKKNIKIFICATEQSGDNIGYNIMYELLKLDNSIIFDGVGGAKMAPFLKNHYYSLKDFNTMGIVEVIFSLKRYIKMISTLISKIISNDYDLIITVDSPDFNYPLAKKLKKLQYKKKIIQVVAPSVWAWREYRAKNFSLVFDQLLVLFKFEIKYFQKYNLKTTLMGHPIHYLDKSFNIKIKKTLNIVFMPGSRLSELNKLFPYFDLAYKYLLKNSSDASIFIPTLPHLENKIKDLVKHWKINTIVTSNISEIENNFNIINRALVCSGTASLEIAKRNIPQLVIYKLNIITELIVNLFVKIKYANIINIVENKMIVPEVTNSNLNKKVFLQEFKKLISDEELASNQIKDINVALKKIAVNEPPYSFAANLIFSYL
jgi:lipid-A-disaccharide synthase